MAKGKICIVTETFAPIVGGGESQALSLAQVFTSRGYQVLVVTRRTDRSVEQSETMGRIKVERVGPVGTKRFSKWLLILTVTWTLIRQRADYDAILVSGFRFLGLSAVAASKLLSRPCILKADSQGEFSGQYFRAGLSKLPFGLRHWLPTIFVALRNIILRKADRFVAISEVILDEFRAQGVDDSLISKIPNGVDTDLFSPGAVEEKEALRKRLGLPSDKRIVVFVGRLVSYKGVEVLLKAWLRLTAKSNNTALLLVGPGGLDIHNCEESAREYVSREGLENRVTFAGQVSNVYEYLQASDIFVLPTQREAFGISIIEAMACGMPVISTRTGGVPEIIKHRENGLMVQPGDPDQLQDAIQELLENPRLARSLAENGRKTVLDRYSLPGIVDKYENLFFCSPETPLVPQLKRPA